MSAKRPRRFVKTTDSDHADPIYLNLAAGFVPSGPDQLWVADITYIQLRKRFVYLAAILDAWSRKVVGYALGTTMETTLTLSALDAACNSRRPQPGLIHHSDRGGQYASKAYRDRLELFGIRGSMSRKGNPYDNAKAESFMKTLKHEEVLKVDYEGLQDLQRRLPHFLEETYNQRRLHSALGYLPPDEFEQLHARCLVNS
jgi:putative transposase